MATLELVGEPFEWPQQGERTYPIIDTWNRYKNPWPTWVMPNILTPIKWKLKQTRRYDLVAPSQEDLDRLLPVLKPSFSPNQNAYTWLGHSTCLFEIDGIGVLTDPIFTESGLVWPNVPILGHHWRRVRPSACQAADLPDHLRLILLSHNHYDHLNYPSMKAILDRFGQQVTVCVGARQGDWFRTWFPDAKIVELGWWQTARFQLGDKTKAFDVICCPKQHWTERIHLYDTNWSLWCGWAVVGPTKKIYFAGDTGYCSAFSEIGREIGPFDVAAIPIGAYNPKELLGPQHVDPSEALQIHLDVKSKKSFGIHWGTFPLGDEPFFEPKEKLIEAVRERGLPADDFVTTCPGFTNLF